MKSGIRSMGLSAYATTAAANALADQEFGHHDMPGTVQRERLSLQLTRPFPQPFENAHRVAHLISANVGDPRFISLIGSIQALGLLTARNYVYVPTLSRPKSRLL